MAAAFNAPVAGVLFAVELILPEINARTVVPVALAATAAAQLDRPLFDNQSYLPLAPLSATALQWTRSLQLAAYVAMGLGIGGAPVLLSPEELSRMGAESAPKGPAWRRLLRRGIRSEMAFFAGITILVGLVTALGAYLFHEGIENGLIGKASQAVLRLVTGQEWAVPARGTSATWWGVLIVLALPTLGLVLAASMVRFFSGGEHGHGVAGVMEAVALRGGRLRVRSALGRVLAAVVTITTGGSVGPEDPNVQIGSMIGSWLGHRMKLLPLPKSASVI